MYELTKQFQFGASHTLHRVIETESSSRIHGHSYRVEVTVRGKPDPENGMIIDLGLFERVLESARDGLHARLLDDIADLAPGTIENLARWIWDRVSPTLPGLFKVSVHRDSAGNSCAYYGPDKEDA